MSHVLLQAAPLVKWYSSMRAPLSAFSLAVSGDRSGDKRTDGRGDQGPHGELVTRMKIRSGGDNQGSDKEMDSGEGKATVKTRTTHVQTGTRARMRIV